jgi:hypothetical protein
MELKQKRPPNDRMQQTSLSLVRMPRQKPILVWAGMVPGANPLGC